MNCTYSQSKKYQSATVMFTNCENLWDTENSVDVVYDKYKFNDPMNRVSMSKEAASIFIQQHQKEADSLGVKLYVDEQILSDEFTPNSMKNWNEDKYIKKLNKIAQIILEIGMQSTSKSVPVVVGVVEVENRKVLEDLVKKTILKKYNFEVAHLNSDDSRGIDVAFLYQKTRFDLKVLKKYFIDLPPNDDGSKAKTRDIVRISGKLDGEDFSFLINHWPSRRGGEARSLPLRAKAAETLKSIYAEIFAKNPNEKIISMGDFNDDPVSPSIKKYLGALETKKGLKSTDIYSPMEKMFKEGKGTLAYQDAWNLFDQFFYSGNLISESNKPSTTYTVFKTEIFSPAHLIATEGQWKGYPKRSWNGDLFVEDGYSDHFPIYSVLLKEIK